MIERVTNKSYPNPPSSLERVFRVSFGIGCCASVLIFVVFPMRWFQVLLNPLHVDLTAFLSPLLFVSSIGTLILYLLYRVFQLDERTDHLPVHSVPRPTNSERHGRTVLILQGLICAVILLQVVMGMNSPLGVDESEHATEFARGALLREINPLQTDPSRDTQNHVIAQMSSMVFMELFGVDKVTGRIPALLFTMALILLLLFFTKQILSRVTICLILGHLAVNQFSLWYMHSMRGYISMMLCTLVVYCMLLKATQEVPLKRRQQLILFWLVFGAALFTGSLSGGCSGGISGGGFSWFLLVIAFTFYRVCFVTL